MSISGGVKFLVGGYKKNSLLFFIFYRPKNGLLATDLQLLSTLNWKTADLVYYA